MKFNSGMWHNLLSDILFLGTNKSGGFEEFIRKSINTELELRRLDIYEYGDMSEKFSYRNIFSFRKIIG
ncbi:MAG: hypothetical protein HC850_07350 [Rhodomicrobium sp.]|nr:hypothetical protein [Rhodomicrobium sp.]